MKGERSPATRAIVVMVVIAVVAVVLMLIGHHSIQEYLSKDRKQDAASPGGVVFEGTVRFADGSIAKGARVEVEWLDPGGNVHRAQRRTGEDGRFSAGDVSGTGELQAIVASAGPVVASVPTTHAASDRADEIERDDVVTLPATFALAGLIRSSAGRTPVVGAKLSIGGRKATSGAGGEFRIADVPANVVREGMPVVHFEAAGFRNMDWPLPMDLPPAAYGDLTILLEPAK